jgi:cytochrome c-type biogenesis protein CcmH/NrfG
MSSLTPEERERIAEEQRVRDQQTMKTGFKYLGRVWLVVGAVFLVFLICVCLILTGSLGAISSSLQ